MQNHYLFASDLEEEYARAAGETGSLGGHVGGNIEELFTALQEEADQPTSRQVSSPSFRASRAIRVKITYMHWTRFSKTYRWPGVS